MSSRRIGVLAVQGAFAEHAARLRHLGCEVVELRQRADVLQPLEGLVLPGGESTTQSKLLRDLGMLEPLRRRIQDGLPTLGTCAGLILLSKNVESASDGRIELEGAGSVAHAVEDGTLYRAAAEFGSPGSGGYWKPTPIEGFRTLPVTVRRNGYGRQLGSFTAIAPPHVKHEEEAALAPDSAPNESAAAQPMIPLTFIRAPRIVEAAPEVETLVELSGKPVAVRFQNQIACCFHPELDPDNTLYQLFLGL